MKLSISTKNLNFQSKKNLVLLSLIVLSISLKILFLHLLPLKI